MATKISCRKSPTKAHFWIEDISKRKGGYGLFKCKHCHKTVWMPITYESARGNEIP